MKERKEEREFVSEFLCYVHNFSSRTLFCFVFNFQVSPLPYRCKENEANINISHSLESWQNMNENMTFKVFIKQWPKAFETISSVIGIL